MIAAVLAEVGWCWDRSRHCPGCCRAIQGQCRASPSQSEAAASCHELGCLRCSPASARQPDGVVHRRGDRGLESRVADHARRPVPLFGPGHRDSADAAVGVPFGPTPDRRVDWFHHRLARPRSLSAGPYNLEPPGREPGRGSPRPGSGPVHLLVDSTGLKLCGSGEWLFEKHGMKTRRSWRKLHIAVDADTGRIAAAALTTNDVDDASQVGLLLDQVDGFSRFVHCRRCLRSRRRLQ